MRYVHILTRSFIDFFRDGGPMLAGAISYFSIMAMVPLCLFLVTFLGYLLGHYQGFYEFLSARLINFFPSITKGITHELSKLITFHGIGLLSLLLYGVLSFQVFASVENALHVIFEVKIKRSFFWSILLALLTVTFLMVVLFISFAATSLIPLLKTVKQVFPELRIGLITAVMIRYVVPFLMVFFTITVIYIFFPRTKVKASYAFVGALFATVFLEVAKHIFTWYAGTVVKFGTIYGPLSAFVLFLLWVFYSSCIFLIGAKLVHNLIISKREW